MFIAVNMPASCGQEKLQCLTTNIMKWSEDAFLFDMTSFIPYWKDLARLTKTDVLSLWKNVINQNFSDALDEDVNEDVDEKPVQESNALCVQLKQPYQAAIANHPWKAVLLLYLLRDRHMTGLIDANQSLATSLFRGMSWDLWWHMIEVLSEHYTQAKLKIFNKTVFRNQCERMRHGMQKLRFSMPSDMRRLPYAGFKKRYGVVLGDVWRWTFDGLTAEERMLFDDGFPWNNFSCKEKPKVTRRLDDLATEWDHLSQELCDDFDKLAMMMHEREKVLSFAWDITINDLSVIHVEIKFRNPHLLISEMGSHKTGLLQGRYAFDDAMQQYTRKKQDDLGGRFLDRDRPYIVGWTLRIEHTVYSPPLADFIFKSLESNADFSSLIQLENELPIPLFRYSLLDDWSPEYSYEGHAASVPSSENRASPLFQSLKAAAEARPLYIYKKPVAYHFSEISNNDFLEKVTSKWWLTGPYDDLERVYHRHREKSGKTLWVFHDAVGGEGAQLPSEHVQWYKHGIFG